MYTMRAGASAHVACKNSGVEPARGGSMMRVVWAGSSVSARFVFDD